MRMAAGMAWLVCALAAHAALAEQVLEVRIAPPPELHVGDRALVRLELTLPAGAPLPLLITPESEGHAVEVVRGRLLRADARKPDENPLQFELPVVAQAVGTSILRVHVVTYVCSDRCRATEVDARANLVVLPR